MKKSVFTGLLSSIILISFALAGLQAFEVDEVILMDHAEGKTENPMYSPTEMPHQLHEEKVDDCQTCHHMWQDECEPPLGCTESGCHDLLGATGAEMSEVESAYFAFHEKDTEQSCMGCHDALEEAGEPAGPLDCNACH